jgi:hypothetical protein
MMIAKVIPKENGFMVEAYNGESLVKETVVEGRDPKKIGAAILMAFAKPRTYKKRAEKAE